jgi:hypothetical protein
MKKIVSILLIAVMLLITGCSVADPWTEDVYAGDIYTHGVLLVPGGGVGDMVKATYDPANIGEQLVGLTAAQSLTNKQLTMNNGDSIYWKDGAGVPKQILFLGGGGFNVVNPTGNGLNFNYDTAGSIYLWGSDEGTGEVLVLYGSNDVTAIDTVHDSPTIDMGAWYWDGAAAAGWSSTILHDMITAGATPKSQLKFAINGSPILRLENNNGTVKTFSDGNLSMVASAIDMSQIGAEPASTANRAGIYAIDLSADNCTIGFNTETAVQVAIGVASTNRIPIRWNGATYYLLAEASGFYSPLAGTVKPTVQQGLRIGLIFLNTDTHLWEKCTSLSPVTWETLPSGSAAWGGITGTLSAQQDLSEALNGKLSTITGTALDNVFNSNGLLKRTGAGTYSIDASNYLTSFTELDPVFGGSAAFGISSGDITNWNAKLSSYTETDPVVKALTGIITSNGTTISAITNSSSSWDAGYTYRLTSASGTAPLTLTLNANGLTGSVDLSSKQTAHANLTSLAALTWVSGSPLIKMTSANTFGLDSTAYLTGNQSISLSGDLSGSGTTSISGTVTGIQGKAITLATGFLKYSGSAWSFDNSTYLTGNQSITISGDASGSGTTAITLTNNGLKGVALPVLSTGYLYYTGSAFAFQTPAGGSNPSWYGKFYGARGDCDPVTQAYHENMLAVAGPTPTGITASLARVVMFTPPANITVTNIRVFGVGATTNLYKFAIYPVGAGSAKTWDSGTVTTAANTWLDITTGTPFTLTAGVKYWWCVTVVSTGTTAGFRSEAAPLGTNFYGANAAPLGGTSLGLPIYAQFAVSTGVFPATLPAVAAAAYSGGTTGSVPFGYLDYGGAK